MKILYFDQFASSWGGQQVLYSVIKHRIEKKDQIEVILLENGTLVTELESLNVKVHVIPFLNSSNYFNKYIVAIVNSPKFINTCYQVIKKFKPDLLYNNSPRIAPFVSILAKLSNTPALFHLHLILSKKLDKIIFSVSSFPTLIKRIIAPSLPTKDALIEFKNSYKKCIVVKNGTQLHENQQAPEYKISKDVTLGFAGRLTVEKGFDLIYPALEKLKARGFNPKLIIAGSTLKELLDSKLFPLSLFPLNLKFETSTLGSLNRSEMNEFYKKCDIILFPSRALEVTGLVILEAMSNGKLVISSDFPAVHDVIESGKNGIILKDLTSEALANAIIESENLDLNEISKLAQKTIRTHFNLNTFHHSIDHLIHEAY